jgi:hypothetical protein
VTWVLATVVILMFLAVAYPVTFVLTALVAGLIDVAGRFVTVTWRTRAAVDRPGDAHHSPVRLVLAVATLLFLLLIAPRVAERLGPISLIAHRLLYGALLVAFAEWLEGRSARPAAWVCFAAMALYAFMFGANVVAHAAIPAAWDAFACAGFLLLAQRAAADDDRARLSHARDPAVSAS